MHYALSGADRSPLPSSFGREDRYRGYRAADRQQPYAGYFRERTMPVQPHVRAAIDGGRAPSGHGYGVSEVADRLARPGYERLETGWARLSDGVVMVAVHTPMPGVTAAMWDWWFGWHGSQSARYKLWHPDAHRYAAWGEDRSTTPGLTDRQRYVDNVSYVDELIGTPLQHLAIRFLSPARLGFDEERPGWTHICARVSLSRHPIAIGWLVHQVRPTADGAEMRSRFFLGDTAVLPLPRHALPPSLPGRLSSTRVGRSALSRVAPRTSRWFLPRSLGADMVEHCAAEMNHLASFLPDLHADLSGTA